MIKMTLLYRHPEDAGAFEQHYTQIHMPLADEMDVERMELTLFNPGPDGSAPEYHRMAELYFKDEAHMAASLASDAGQAAAADVPNFCPEGAISMFATV